MTAIALTEPLSPELALVCPELRQRALALLPDAPWLRPSTAASPAVASAARATREPFSPLPVRIAVYATARAAATAAEGAVFAGAVAGLALGLSVVG